MVLQWVDLLVHSMAMKMAAMLVYRSALKMAEM